MLHSPIIFNKHLLSHKTNNRGFTLVEIVVVSSVLAFLMSTIWLSGSLRESDFTAMINQERLRLLITRAKSMTLSGIVPAGGDTCGHGVRIERNRAFIFLDRGRCGVGSDRIYNEGEKVPGEVNSILLKEGVTFSTSLGDNVDIVFIPPDPRTAINGNEAISDGVSIQINLPPPSEIRRRITVNNQGLIDAPRN